SHASAAVQPFDIGPDAPLLGRSNRCDPRFPPIASRGNPIATHRAGKVNVGGRVYLSDGFFLPFDNISTVFARRAARVSGFFASTIHVTYSRLCEYASGSKAARALAFLANSC